MILSQETMPGKVDCLVLGGGITGVGIARDAAMRGLAVLLVESDDFASGTSHLTSKVIHGGLRYLEHGHIRPVIEGIIERDRLLNRMAPNLIRPLKFVMPFEGHRFPKWLLTLCGLQLYGLPEWYHRGRTSGAMLGVRLQRDYPTMRPHPFAVFFWDAQTNDARLVMAALRTAQIEGATICNYTSITEARFENELWTLRLRSNRHQREWVVRTRMLINATGPWSPLTARLLGVEPMELTWVKGSHIVLRRPREFGDDALIMRSVYDLRPLWAIPWHNRLIVGSTESRFTGDLRDIRATTAEIDDLFESFVRTFPGAGITRSDIRCAYAGVRPIIPQGRGSENSLSREHRIEVDRSRRLATILGGKLTTFRRMAEQTVDKVDRLLGRRPPRYALRSRLRRALLWPGLTSMEIKRLRANLTRVFGSSVRGADVIGHLVRHYGWDASLVLDEVARQPGLGDPVFEGMPYCLAELRYLCRTEKVYHLIDLVKRRTPIYFLVDNSGFESLSLVVKHVAPILGWNEERQADELSAVADEFRADMQACADSDLPMSRQQPETVCA